MATLNLFPTRVPIGTVVDGAGNRCDVLMTPEFSRALASVLDRIGGPSGSSTAEISALVQSLAVIEAFATPAAMTAPADIFFSDSAMAPQLADLRASLDDLRELFAISPDALAQLSVLRAAIDDVQKTIALAPDCLAQLMEVAKELRRRPSTLAQGAIAVSVTGTLAATVLATVVVPPNAMGRNGMLRITTTWSVTNSANNKTIVTRFGGTDISSNAVTTASTYQEQRMIQNRNAANSQVFIFGGAAYTGSPIGTMAKDTTIAQNIDIVAQLSNVGETITLEAYTVELLPST